MKIQNILIILLVTAIFSSCSNNNIDTEKGALVMDNEAIKGTWALVEEIKTVGEISMTQKHELDSEDLGVFVFDESTITVTYGKNPLIKGEYSVDKGVLKYVDNKPGSRPISYTDLRSDKEYLTAVFKDKDIKVEMKWKKVN